MIRNISFHNMRGIARGRLEDLSKVNVLMGPNNSGKSTVLEALYLLGVSGREASISIQEEKPYPVWLPLELDMLGEAPIPRLWKRHGDPGEWPKSFELNVHQGTADLSFELSFLDHQEYLRSFIIYLDQVRKRDLRTTAFLASRDQVPLQIPSWVQAYCPSSNEFDEPVHLGLLWYPGFVHAKANVAAWVASGSLPDPGNVLFFDQHTAMQHLSAHFYNLLKKISERFPWSKEAGKHFASLFDLKGNVIVKVEPHPHFAGKRNVVYQGVVETDVNLPIDHWGDGARHAFKVLLGLTVLSQSVNDNGRGLFLWEDSELYMHPATLGRLLAIVLELIRERPIQVFIATQSTDVIAFLTDFATKGKLNPADLRTFRLGLKEDGRLIFSKFKHESLMAWLRDGLDPRFWDLPDMPLSYQLGGKEE